MSGASCLVSRVSPTLILSAISYRLSAIGHKHMLYKLIKPLLFRLEPERAHELITSMLRMAVRGKLPMALIEAMLAYNDPILRVECAGLHFSNPIGLAAGFDKHGELIRPMASLGFGHIELGTVTPRPQPGLSLIHI